MNPVELIRKKREGLELTREELRQLIDGYVAGTIPDYQMSAWLMAVVFRGMTEAETSAFTDLMLHSGAVFDLSDIPGVKVDKHSTGGVGDKVSLILAPMVAACGVPVPMISGRGLGHTGGTLDKLESIPGFRTAIPMDEYRAIIAECGLVLAGQTAEVVPADRKLYALRDVTATVEAIPLIAGSIMSKKLAEGIDALVLDIKTGNGAFMREERDSVALARALVDIGNRAGKRTIGFVTGMDQPLGKAVGNWLEVVESVDCLKGKPVADLMEVTYVLGGAMVYLGGKAPDIASGMKLCREAIYSGRALEKFLALVRRQGGDLSFLSGSVHRIPGRGRTIEVRSERTRVSERLRYASHRHACHRAGGGAKDPRRCRGSQGGDPSAEEVGGGDPRRRSSGRDVHGQRRLRDPRARGFPFMPHVHRHPRGSPAAHPRPRRPRWGPPLADACGPLEDPTPDHPAFESTSSIASWIRPLLARMSWR